MLIVDVRIVFEHLGVNYIFLLPVLVAFGLSHSRVLLNDACWKRHVVVLAVELPYLLIWVLFIGRLRVLPSVFFVLLVHDHFALKLNALFAVGGWLDVGGRARIPVVG